MKTFRECHRKEYYRYTLGYRPEKEPWNLWFGSLVHLCLERYWRARQAGRPNPIGEMLEPLLDESIDPFDKAKAKVMLIAYGAIWNQTKCTVIGVEVQFEMPHVNPITGAVSDYWIRAGKMDAIMQFRHDVGPLEHKTSAADIGAGSDYRRRLTLDEQISFYFAAAEHLGYKPSFVGYDVLRKPSVKPLRATLNPKMTQGKPAKPPSKKFPEGVPEELPRPYANQQLTDETVNEYFERLAQEYREEPESKIQRVRVQRSREERKQFHLTVWQTSQIMQICDQNNLHPPNSDACFSHGSPCEFFGVCEGTASLKDETLFKKLDSVNPELVVDGAVKPQI